MAEKDLTDILMASSSGGSTPFIYPEYQAQMQELARKRAMAQYLFQQSMNQPTQVVSGVAVKKPILGRLAQAITALGSNQQLGESVKEQQNILMQNMAKEQQDVTSMLSEPDRQRQIALGLRSNNPRLQALAAARQKLWADLAKTQGDVVGRGGDIQSASNIVAGGMPQEGYRYTPGKTTFGAHEGNVYAETPGEWGKKDFRWAPKGTSIDIGDRTEGKEMTAASVKDLTAKIESAREAQTALGNNARILEELEAGAATGGLEKYKQLVRKVFEGFGVSIPATGPTETVKVALAENIFVKAKALRPVSVDEKNFLLEQVGSIDTNPQALANILSWYNGQALRSLQEFSSTYDILKQDSKYGRQYEALGAGLKMPQTLYGPPWFQLMQLKQLQRLGGDISMYGDKSGAIPKDAKFDIRPPNWGLGAAPTPAPSKPPAQMTLPELEARIKQLEAQLSKQAKPPGTNP